MQEVKKIVVIGPESTGKSTLCKDLAAHFKTIWCEEYAREYLTMHGTNYTYDDLLVIARGQVTKEEEYLTLLNGGSTPANAGRQIVNNQMPTVPPIGNTPLLFIDTNLYVMKVWCEFVFGECHSFITDQIAERKYDLYLLCNTDLPWIKDELREYPDLETREKLFHIYKNILVSQPVPWVEIGGTNVERKQTAIEAVEEFLNTSR